VADPTVYPDYHSFVDCWSYKPVGFTQETLWPEGFDPESAGVIFDRASAKTCPIVKWSSPYR
jgi:hypothetical protein